MVTHVDVDVQQLWKDYRMEPTVELRNQLVELYLPLVKYNAERIWSRLPDGVDAASSEASRLCMAVVMPRPERRLSGGCSRNDVVR